MRKLGRFGGDDGEGSGISPCGDKGLVVEQGTENGELERFVILPTDDKGGVQKLLEFLDQGSGEFVLLLDGGEVIWPVCVDVLLDKFFDGVFRSGESVMGGPFVEGFSESGGVLLLSGVIR